MNLIKNVKVFQFKNPDFTVLNTKQQIQKMMRDIPIVIRNKDDSINYCNPYYFTVIGQIYTDVEIRGDEIYATVMIYNRFEDIDNIEFLGYEVNVDISNSNKATKELYVKYVNCVEVKCINMKQ